MELTVFFIAPTIIFLVIVAPTWIIFHHITKWKTLKQQELGHGKVAVNKDDLLKLHNTGKRLEERIVTLERILNQD